MRCLLKLMRGEWHQLVKRICVYIFMWTPFFLYVRVEVRQLFRPRKACLKVWRTEIFCQTVICGRQWWKIAFNGLQKVSKYAIFCDGSLSLSWAEQCRESVSVFQPKPFILRHNRLFRWPQMRPVISERLTMVAANPTEYSYSPYLPWGCRLAELASATTTVES